MGAKRIALFLGIILITGAYWPAAAADAEEEPLYRARVIGVRTVKPTAEQAALGLNQEGQLVTVRILNGPHQGRIMTTLNQRTGNLAYDIVVKKGDEVLVLAEEERGRLKAVHLADFVRDRFLAVLAAVFVALLALIGGRKGLKSLAALVFTALAVAFVMLPLLLRGAKPIPATILTAAAVTAVTFLLVAGANRKSLAATIGTTCGVICAGAAALSVGKTAHLTGLGQEEAAMLQYIPQNIRFDFQGLLFAGIIIGALGAVMDVAMSISSAMHEIHKADPAAGRWKLLRAGMNVGRDVMGTMTNTLILAYAGAAIPMILLFMAYRISLIKALNLDMIATEVVQAMAGSIGLILAIPITALAAAVLLYREEKKTGGPR